MGTSESRIAIIGAGIGGLSLALALRERGIRADVFEQAAELTEIGAAIGIAGNSTREFARLGLLDQLSAAATMPTELIYRDWRTGERIAAHPVADGDWYVRRFGAPWFGLHRADLQMILAGALGGENLHLGCRLVDIVERADSVVVEFANGRVEEVDLVVGADGVRSTVRRWVTGADDAVYSGTSAFRGIVPVENLPAMPDPHAIQFWMGPDAHVLHYAIGGGSDSINFFAVVEGPKSWTAEGSVAPVGEDVPVASFRGWHPAIIEMIRAAASPIRWSLSTVRPLLRWHRGRVVILGDAAHGMLPHHGQGANTSIEDAFVLAALLAEAKPDGFEQALAHYQSLRRARTRKIRRSSWATNALLHLREGPAVRERDATMARVPDTFAWIHEYDVQQALHDGGAAPVPGHLTRQDEALAGLAQVLGAVANVDAADVTPMARFDEDLGIDSLGLVDVIVALEDRFGLVIPDDDWTRFTTVDDAITHLQRAARLPS